MRFLTILLAFLLLLAGPVMYLGPGAEARREKRDTLASLEAQAAAMDEDTAALSRPPSRQALERLKEDLDQRREARTSVLATVFAFARTPPPGDVELRRAGEAAGLEPGLLDPLFAQTRDGPIGAARRHVLGALFAALGEAPAVKVHDVRVARDATLPDAAAGIEALRVQLTVIGEATPVHALAAALLATKPGSPYMDLVHVEVAPMPESAESAEHPTVKLVLGIDALIREAP